MKQIAASPATVWQHTEDVERWPQWTPTAESVVRLDGGPFDVGSTARVKQPGLPETVWRVTALSRGESFTWETRVRGLRMVATHEVRPDGAGARNLLRLEVTGLAAMLLWPLVRSSSRRALEQENAGLARACEAAADPGPSDDPA